MIWENPLIRALLLSRTIQAMSFPVVAVRQPDRAVLHVSIRGPIEVGRECDGLLLGDVQVSRRHLLLDVADGMTVVTDLGSTNGTQIDGDTINSPMVLMPGSTVELGNTTIVLVEEDVAAEPVPAASSASGATVVTGSNGQVAPDNVAPTPQPADAETGKTSIELVATSVADAGLDLRRLNTDQGTVTIVFSDIEASAERNMALGDQDWLQVRSEHNRIIRRLLAEYNGSEVSNQDDGFMLSFPGARMALACMVEVQRQIHQQASIDPDRAVKIRVGLHTGEVVVDDGGDLFGQHVAMAARVADLASGGEVLVSSVVKEITQARGDVVFGEPRQATLKGIGGEHWVYPVDWSESLPV